MATHDKYYPGSTVSRHLPAGERSWLEVVYQSGKPATDSEVILNQEIRQEASKLISARTSPSGWLQGPLSQLDPYNDYDFPAPGDPDFVADAFRIAKRTALVAGMPVVVEYTETADAGWNVVQLDAAPTFGGAPPDVKRTDFVFLEVFLALVSDSPNASGTLVVLPALPAPGDTYLINGVPLTAVAVPPGVDEFLIGGDEATTASNIAAALNNPANSFSATVSAATSITSTDTVLVRAQVSGAAGNAITTSITGVGWTVSGATLAGGADTANKPTQDTIYRNGNVLADPSVNLADEIADPVIGSETTKRVQVQYRIRVTGQTEAVNFKTQQDGFSNTGVLAQGTQASPVATYPFVKADGSSSSGNSDAAAYDIIDDGLWIAGNGSSAAATALGTVDGYVYAIPICFVFRRNNAGGGNGFDPLANTNGALSYNHGGFANPIIGAIGAGQSDRPDGYFHDHIVTTDVLDLRKGIAPGGIDFAGELQRQMQRVLDGTLGTWALDGADKQDLGGGSGDVSRIYLVCNEAGRSAAEGGVSPTAGDTPRGADIGNFDHIRRRFADHPVVERVVLALYPTDAVGAEPGKYVTKAGYAGAFAGWAEDDTINIDLGSLNATGDGSWADATKTYVGGSGGSVSGFWPVGATISNITGAWHDDGHYTVAVAQDVQFKQITGIGTDYVQLVLDSNVAQVNGGDGGNPDQDMVGGSISGDVGSQRRIFVEVEITYPLGSGTTDTPDLTVTPDAAIYPEGPILENDTTQRPSDWEQLSTVRFREGKREAMIEYVANLPGSGAGSGTPITDSIVSSNRTSLRFPRRVFGSAALTTGVTDSVAAQPHDIDSANTEYGSSSRLVTLDTSGGPPTKQPLSGLGQTLCAISYFAQDPVPNYGAGGYQVAFYYRTNAPQTAGSKTGGVSLPGSLLVKPLLVPPSVWTGTVGTGSVDLPYPYLVPMDQIPVHGDIGVGSYPGEWYFAATAQISVDDFSADTGLLNLHAMVPMDQTGTFTFESPDIDIEFRAHYKVANLSTYRPSVFAQPLSNSTRHKVWVPFLAVANDDTSLWRKNELLLIVVTRFAELDDENTVRFVDSSPATCAGIYRTSGHLMIALE